MPPCPIDVVDLLELDDKELLRRHVAGDAAAFGEIFRRHRDRMWAVATRVVHDRELAADCVQDAFIAAFRHAGNYRGDAAVTTWLHRITVNACMDRLRRDKHVVRRAGDLGDIDLVDEQDLHSAAEAVLDVRAALARLPEPQRLAIVLVDLQGMSIAEAAEVLEVAEGTIKSRCSRGREALAALLRPPLESSADDTSDDTSHTPTGTRTSPPTSDTMGRSPTAAPPPRPVTAREEDP